MDQFRSETDDLTAGVLCSLKDHCQSLRAFSDDWRHGINNRGARKFIRGLAESQSIEEDGLSELDRHLTYLIDICSEISDLTRHATQIGHKLITQANVSARLAGLWHGLSLKTNEAELCESLQQPIDEAQMLVRLAPGLHPSKFIINPVSGCILGDATLIVCLIFGSMILIININLYLNRLQIIVNL